MKRKSRVRILIYALPLLGVTTVFAATAKETATVERRIEVRSLTGGELEIGPPAPPATPVTFLGLEVDAADETLAAQLKLPEGHGLVIRHVVPDSPAAQAGLVKNDVLVKLDDQLLIAPRQLSALVRNHKEGDTINLTYLRAGSESRATATLVQRVPPRTAMSQEFRWLSPHETPMSPNVRPFIWRSDQDAPDAPAAEGTPSIAPRAPGSPHVMIFRPQTRIVYREDDMTLEVFADQNGQKLEARGPDGAVIFSGPIATPEQRSAVPAPLQKYLQKLDALEPAKVRVPAPALLPSATPAPPVS
jgi:membrane-associated protease RseP (regulator of RpoE activity)